MFDIAYYSSEQKELDEGVKCLCQWLKNKNIETNIDSFSCIKKMQLVLEMKPYQYSIVVLDIQNSPLTVIDFAKKIRSTNKAVEFIFLSDHNQFAAESYEVGAISYLTKPLTPEKIDRVVALLEEKNDIAKRILIKEGKINHYISVKDIVLISSFYRKVSICLRDFTIIHSAKPLNIVAEQLPIEWFESIHKSYVVNIDYIDYIERYKATLKDGTKVPISKANYKKVKQRLFLMAQTNI